MLIFVRTCQECGKRIRANEPKAAPSNAYLYKACPRCRSEAFDYGSQQDVDPVTLEILPWIIDDEEA